MLSQKITKETLLLSKESDFIKRLQAKDTLKETLNLWKSSHNALLNRIDSLNLPGKNSEKIRSMYKTIDPFYDTILNNANRLIYKIESNDQIPNSDLNNNVYSISENENNFLLLMDEIVNQYNIEASAKVDRLRNLELLLMAFTLIILFMEFLFIFWPTAKAVKSTIFNLLKSEKKAIKMAYDADILREENEKSVKELRTLNQVMDQTLLFARVASDGSIIHIGEKFTSLFNMSRFNNRQKFSDVISTNKNEQEIVDDLLLTHNKSGWQGEVKTTTKDDESLWLEMYIIPFYSIKEKSELLIIASDITEKKKAQLEVETLTKLSYEEKMNQQKIISSKIIENQEKEQNRIAKDIHDGIGQMLTGLKFNLESVNLNDREKALTKIENLKELTTSIIQGVRTATFNLTPPELSDYGIASALTKLTQELSKLTNKNIKFFNKTDFDKRLDSLTEVNIYRITQEAINNAIKYANSSHIVVMLSHSKNILSITIEDNGVGFNSKKPKSTKKGTGGMGMTFMKERVNYINGRLFVNSSPENGTKITVNIPLEKLGTNT